MFMPQGQTSTPHLMCVSCIYVYLWMFALASCFHSPPCLINISFSLPFNCKFEHMLWLKEKSKTTKRDIFVSYWGCPPQFKWCTVMAHKFPWIPGNHDLPGGRGIWRVGDRQSSLVKHYSYHQRLTAHHWQHCFIAHCFSGFLCASGNRSGQLKNLSSSLLIPKINLRHFAMN